MLIMISLYSVSFKILYACDYSLNHNFNCLGDPVFGIQVALPLAQRWHLCTHFQVSVQLQRPLVLGILDPRFKSEDALCFPSH